MTENVQPVALPRPYYEDDAVTLYNADWRDLLYEFADNQFAAVITDPPYTDRTHGQAKTNKGNGHGVKAIDFAPFTDAELREFLERCAELSSGWVIASLDYAHAFAFDQEPPRGLRSLRVGVWVKPNPMPQISADRPGQGWEAISFLHRADVKPSWNGGGRAGVWTHPVVQNTGHPTAKPLPMVSDWVRLFTAEGDLILDPFAGSGTTLRAAKDEGRKAIGIEINEAYCELAAQRLTQDNLFGGAA